MGKSTHFIGQPLYGELIKFLDRGKISELSRTNGGERYVKSFDGWQHLIVMLYAVIMRFDSLREITASMLVEARKLQHIGMSTMPRRSTLSDANARRPEKFFGEVYRHLYATYRDRLSADSRGGNMPGWFHRLKIIDSTTITLFSNLVFKGAGRNPRAGKKKGGLKVHSVIHANEGVHSDVQFTSAATNDSFMLKPKDFEREDIVALDRAYINYAKFEELSNRGVVYVTKLKKNLVYMTLSDGKIQTSEVYGDIMEQAVMFDVEKTGHTARIVTYEDKKKDGSSKKVSLLTNDFDMPPQTIVEIYRKRWEIESLFKQIKQNFPLRYFYGESANAIKIQVWVTLIANLLIMLLKSGIRRSWSFSGLATMVRLMLMSYLNPYTLLESPESDWLSIVEAMQKAPPQPSLFD